MIHIFVNNYFCVACIIFALTIFKGNELLQLNRMQMLNYSIVFLTFVLKFGIRQFFEKCSHASRS
jgi:hypothetical protein